MLVISMIAYNEDKAREFIENVKAFDPLFMLAIAYTETAEIPNITIAGANKDMIKYTPPADAELINYGYCKCIDIIPATPDGKPTPALLTRAALRLADIPMLVIDAGSKVKPKLPYIDIDARHGNNIINSKALDDDVVESIYNNAKELGKALSKLNRFMIIGESIPAGTTTALAVLLALGIDARFRVSSSMPNNPHNLKIKVVSKAMDKHGISIGGFKDDPLKAVEYLGDPMLLSVAGIVIGASINDARVMLAGGTQMAAVLAIIKHLKYDINIAIGTTRYIIDDQSSDIIGLIKEIDANIPILASDPLLAISSKEGLRAYANGFVKEGAGAGGAMLAAMLKGYDSKDILNKIEEEYEQIIS